MVYRPRANFGWSSEGSFSQHCVFWAILKGKIEREINKKQTAAGKSVISLAVSCVIVMITKQGGKKKGTRVVFPQRLFSLLRLAEENNWEHIISWVNDGAGFKVHDRKLFEKQLLSKYFNTTRYASFTRQLHAYSFDCVRTGRQTGICKFCYCSFLLHLHFHASVVLIVSFSSDFRLTSEIPPKQSRNLLFIGKRDTQSEFLQGSNLQA